MTAINMFVQPKGQAGYIVADCAITDPDGNFREACSKVAYNTGRFPFAVGVTGNVHPVTMAKAIGAANITSLKQLIKRLPDVMRSAMAATADDGVLALCDVQLGLKGVAWDFANKRPVGFVLVSDPMLFPGCAPFVFYDSDFALTKWDGAESVAEMIGAGVSITDPAQFDAAIDGLKLIEKQRQEPMVISLHNVDQSIRHWIGGGAHLYCITKHGVTAELLRDWQDPIGKPISPFSFPSTQASEFV